MSSVDPSTTIKLNTGAEMPIIAIGGFGGPTAETRFAARDWLLTALKSGYRHIDTAANYYAEESVGAAIRNSGIARNELFVTTKLPMNGHGRVKYCFEHSLKELGLDYIDLYLMHYPVPVAYEEGNDSPTNPDGTIRVDETVTLNDIWADMEALQETGKVKALGVSNFSPKTLDQLLKTAKVVPAVNQVEKIYDNTVKTKASLSALTPRPVRKLNKKSSSSTGRDIVRNDPKIVELAAKNEITPNQLILGWHLARGVAIIPGSKDPERQKENLKVPIIADEDVKQINALDRNDRIMNKYRVIKGTLWGWTYEQYGW